MIRKDQRDKKGDDHLTLRESERVELKQEYTEGIRKEIIAFANTDGGDIYIGVDDAGQTVGVDAPDQVIQRVANAVRDAVKPDVTMFLHYEPVEMDGRQVVRVTVSRGTGRPYYLAAKGLRPEGVYVRQGTSAAPATEAAIRQMIKETDGDTYESMRALNQELTFDYAKRAFSERGIPLEAPQMRTLGITMPDGIYTNLGLLLSDQCPHIIKAALFSGTDAERFQDRREFTGSLLKQVDDAYSYLDMRNELSATFEGLRRIDRRAYPESALREALLNAVIHRDYALSASTLISLYADRLEIVSVGGLVQGVTLRDVMMGMSICRNPKLANVFYRLELIEAYGTGLKKIRSAYRNIAPERLFQTTDHVFKVLLPRQTGEGGDGLSPSATDEEKILSCLETRGQMTRAEAEKLTGLSTSSVHRLLRRLTDAGRVTATGKGRSVRYRPVSPPAM